MKKSLLAASLLATFGAAFAQTATMPQVSLSGIADIAVGSEKANGLTNTVVRSGSVNGSRITIKADQAVGNGMGVFAQVETGVKLDTAGETGFGLGNRQAFVGLKGGFGTVSAGRHYSAYDDLFGDLEPTGVDDFFASRVWAMHAGRVNNSVKYQSNNYGGFSFETMFGLGENAEAAKPAVAAVAPAMGVAAVAAVPAVPAHKAGNDVSAHARYAAGPLMVGVGVQSTKGYDAGYSTKTNSTLLGASYDLRVVKLTAMLNTTKVDTDSKIKGMTLGANIPFGQMSVDLGLASAKQDGTKANSIGARLNYELNKQLLTYVGLNNTKIDGEKSSLIAAGLRYKF
jgi:predicted porin